MYSISQLVFPDFSLSFSCFHMPSSKRYYLCAWKTLKPFFEICMTNFASMHFSHLVKDSRIVDLMTKVKYRALRSLKYFGHEYFSKRKKFNDHEECIELEWNMGIKIYFLHSHLCRFLQNFVDFSDQNSDSDFVFVGEGTRYCIWWQIVTAIGNEFYLKLCIKRGLVKEIMFWFSAYFGWNDETAYKKKKIKCLTNHSGFLLSNIMDIVHNRSKNFSNQWY